MIKQGRLMIQQMLALMVVVSITLMAAPAMADELLIQRMERNDGMVMPARGQSMTQVESRFGVPDQRHGAVGEPPITRWTYADFTVYFEGQYVIDSVANLGEAESLSNG